MLKRDVRLLHMETIIQLSMRLPMLYIAGYIAVIAKLQLGKSFANHLHGTRDCKYESKFSLRLLRSILLPSICHPQEMLMLGNLVYYSNYLHASIRAE